MFQKLSFWKVASSGSGAENASTTKKSKSLFSNIARRSSRKKTLDNELDELQETHQAEKFKMSREIASLRQEIAKKRFANAELKARYSEWDEIRARLEQKIKTKEYEIKGLKAEVEERNTTLMDYVMKFHALELKMNTSKTAGETQVSEGDFLVTHEDEKEEIDDAAAVIEEEEKSVEKEPSTAGRGSKRFLVPCEGNDGSEEMAFLPTVLEEGELEVGAKWEDLPAGKESRLPFSKHLVPIAVFLVASAFLFVLLPKYTPMHQCHVNTALQGITTSTTTAKGGVVHSSSSSSSASSYKARPSSSHRKPSFLAAAAAATTTNEECTMMDEKVDPLKELFDLAGWE